MVMLWDVIHPAEEDQTVLDHVNWENEAHCFSKARGI